MFSKPTRFESLLEAVPNALVGMDQSGLIRFVNRQTESLFGYDRDELVGQHIQTLVPENLWRIFAEHREGYFSDPRTRSMGLDLLLSARSSNGETFAVEVNLSPIDTGDVLLEVAAVRDQTNQKRAFQTAERTAAMVKYSMDAIIGKTVRGSITSWNPAAERMYGYSSTEIIGRSIEILAPADRKGEITRILALVKAGQSVQHFETMRVRKDGTAIAVSISVSPIRDEDGVIVGASTIARDMSERRKAFEAARAMIESSQDSLVTLNPRGRITDANDATVKVTGVPREQLIGSAFSDYFTDPQTAAEIYKRVFTQFKPVDYPLTIRHRDGTLTDVVYNGSVHWGAGGNVLGVFAAVRNVTQLKQALEATRAMIESSLDALVSISPQGKIADVNEATVKVTGVSREQLIGTAFSDYFTDPQKVKAIYQTVFAEGMAVNHELTIRHREGTYTNVLCNASVHRDAGGNVLGVFVAARDMTQQSPCPEQGRRPASQ